MIALIHRQKEIEGKERRWNGVNQAPVHTCWDRRKFGGWWATCRAQRRNCPGHYVKFLNLWMEQTNHHYHAA